MGTHPVAETVEVRAERIGGIDETAVTLPPGVTALVGRNATNRTSFLRALMAAAGSTDVAVKGDAETGRVRLALGEETYERRLDARDGEVTGTGEGYLDDPTVADLFAFILESNPARQAVVRGSDLRDLIMEPVDTEAIEAEIERLRAEQRELEADLDRLEDIDEELPELRARRRELEERLAAKQDALASKREALATLEDALDESRTDTPGVEGRLGRLRAKRRERKRVRSDLDIEEATAARLRTEIEDLEAEREALSDAPTDEIAALEEEIESLRARKREAEASINDLQRIIQFNEEMLDGARIDLLEERLGSPDAGPEERSEGASAPASVVCWTCGSTVAEDAIESTCDRLRRVRKEELNAATSLEERIDDRTERREELRHTQRQAEEVDAELRSLREELSATEEAIGDLRARADELDDAIADLEVDLESLASDTYTELLEVHGEVNELEFEAERLRGERDELQERIDRLERRVAEREGLEADLEAVRGEIRDRRARIERTEEEAVERFNGQMDDLLDALEYENLDRIWLEPRDASDGGRDGRRVFKLHVVRRTDTGRRYEDTIDHLSESEREITGIVFALAGYLAHDVYEESPFLLLDSLEAIDSGRIATLLEYVSDYAAYVVVALLPEDAQALEDGYNYVADI